MFQLTGLSPAEGSSSIPVDSLIEFTILDDGTGIEISTLIVEVLGARAYDNGTFKAGYAGVFSELTADSGNYQVVIHPEVNFEIGQVVSVKIQVQNGNGKYFNTTYVFKTIPLAPVLVGSSPENDQVLVSPQTLYLQFEDQFDGVKASSINISLNDVPIVINGAFQSGYNGKNSQFVSVSGGLGIRVDPELPLRNRRYILDYEVADLSGNLSKGKLHFEVNLPIVVSPVVFPQTEFLGFFQGIKKVSDEGRGDTLFLEWHKPLSKTYQSEGFTVIYENPKRLEIFDTQPKYIAAVGVLEAHVVGLTPGKTLHYAARALDASVGNLDLTGMTAMDDDFYLVPEPVEVSQTISETENKIYVTSTDGFPNKGYLVVGNEVVRYTAKSQVDTAFLVANNGRGLEYTTAGIHLTGDSVRLFFGCQDENTVIVQATPSYQDGYASGRVFNNIGLVVTDYSDIDSKVFDGFDFCGYHQSIPWQTLNGKNDCGSYLGGEFNGFRGMSLFDQLLNREEVLLDTVGEPVILLRRKWNGETCSCSTSRGQHPKMRTCKECYGTSYIGGYDKFSNLRRADRKIVMKFPETTEDLPLGDHQHLYQDYKPVCWTISMPAIRDRDLIIRFDFTGDREFLYEVLNVSREKLVFGQYARQKVALQRIDKTDVKYTFPIGL